MVKSGVIPVLLHLLNSQSDALIELSAVAMLILSSCSVNRSAIACSGAVHALISVIDGERHGTRAKLDAVATLHNLSSLPQTMPVVIASGGVSSLVNLLIYSDKSSEMAEKVTALLEIAVLSSSDSLVKEIGAIHAVVEVVEEGTTMGREHAVAVLLQVCRSRREVYRETIVRAGAAPALLQLGAYGSRRARRMARELLRLLREQDCSEIDTKQLRKLEFMEKIMREIDADGDIVVGATLRLVEEMIAKMRHEPLVIG